MKFILIPVNICWSLFYEIDQNFSCVLMQPWAKTKQYSLDSLKCVVFGNKWKGICCFRNSVKSTTELVKKADSKPAIVRHGVHHFRKINHDDPIVNVVYNPSTEVFVAVVWFIYYLPFGCFHVECWCCQIFSFQF